MANPKSRVDKIIKLTKGKFAIVDDVDFQELSKVKWFYDGKYACRMLPTKDGKRLKMRMHHQIIGRQHGKQVDHINLNKLDNRRENLRQCSPSENSINRPRRIDNRSGNTGVFFNSRTKKWQAYIGKNRKLIHLGFYKNKSEALDARVVAENLYHKI